ncbi:MULTISPECIES: enoyl-CoA hydratase/isomerase family protein [Amycolatopsis methanolica group]|uniref:Enoyl-CoA hydratase/isomerase n=1 Tax=Amycolatopsis methanolica 239 TaxID=1068978 RepID=A0A076N1D3_AMYME|nr:enoyl-CoA hydratase/isomerase family protein [Amycolatopsis methanolica]AIJ24640.1 enoyl-CoA hydratase/isomerase [Amycolatopsis methanolica 239]
MSEEIQVSGTGPVRQLLLNRPARHNAQTPRMWAELAAAGRALGVDPEVRCVVVTGAGGSFSSGIDLDEMREPAGFLRSLAAHPPGDPDPMMAEIAVAQEAFRWMAGAPFLVVAAVTGVAFGAGCQLALACDVRIVATDARLALREVRYGLIPDMGATHSLPRLVGRQHALDLILSGRELSGAEVVARGIALHDHPAAEVLDAATAYAHELARVPRAGIAHVKAAVDEPDLDRNLRIAGLGQAACVRQASWPE